MKHITYPIVYVIFTALLLSSSTVARAAPQGKYKRPIKVAGRTSSWVKWSPPGEIFSVELPSKPSRERLDASDTNAASGWTYRLTNGGVSYTVMSLDQLPGWLDNRNADPEESLRQVVGNDKVTINFQREQRLSKYSGRQYPFTTSDGDPGLIRVYLIKERIYVLTGSGTIMDGRAIKRFLDSFKIDVIDDFIIYVPEPVTPVTPHKGPPVITPMPPCKCSYSQDRNAEICYHPKLELTPEEQVGGLTGKIHLTAELTVGGTVIVNVGSVKVEGELPDALIQRAIDVTRQIKFCPAVLRGKKVPQGMSVVYEVKEYVVK